LFFSANHVVGPFLFVLLIEGFFSKRFLVLLELPSIFAFLHLVAARVSATTSTFVLSADLGLSADVGSGVLAVNTTEVTEGLAGTTRTLEENGGGTSGALKSKLVEGQDAAAGLNDASAGSLGDAESGNVQLGDLQKSGVVGDGANDNGDVLSILSLEVLGDLAKRDGGSVDTGHTESLEDNLVEVGLSSAGQELVQLQYNFQLVSHLTP
jgi:hypothetical protein